MSSSHKVKKFLTLRETTEYLSTTFSENLNQRDVIQLVIDHQLTLTLYLRDMPGIKCSFSTDEELLERIEQGEGPQTRWGPFCTSAPMLGGGQLIYYKSVDRLNGPYDLWLGRQEGYKYHYAQFFNGEYFGPIHLTELGSPRMFCLANRDVIDDDAIIIEEYSFNWIPGVAEIVFRTENIETAISLLANNSHRETAYGPTPHSKQERRERVLSDWLETSSEKPDQITMTREAVWQELTQRDRVLFAPSSTATMNKFFTTQQICRFKLGRKG